MMDCCLSCYRNESTLTDVRGSDIFETRLLNLLTANGRDAPSGVSIFISRNDLNIK